MRVIIEDDWKGYGVHDARLLEGRAGVFAFVDQHCRDRDTVEAGQAVQGIIAHLVRPRSSLFVPTKFGQNIKRHSRRASVERFAISGMPTTTC
jgi:hypothetical protein